IEVGAFPGAHVPVEQRALVGRVRRSPLCIPTITRAHGLPGPLQNAVDGCRRAAEKRDDFGDGPADHIAQNQGGALPRGQHLNGRYEREANSFAHLVAALRLRGWIGNPLELKVRVWFEPWDLA